MTNNPSRRDFLKSGLAASAILMVWKRESPNLERIEIQEVVSRICQFIEGRRGLE